MMVIRTLNLLPKRVTAKMEDLVVQEKSTNLFVNEVVEVVMVNTVEINFFAVEMVVERIDIKKDDMVGQTILEIVTLEIDNDLVLESVMGVTTEINLAKHYENLIVVISVEINVVMAVEIKLDKGVQTQI